MEEGRSLTFLGVEIFMCGCIFANKDVYKIAYQLAKKTVLKRSTMVCSVVKLPEIK